MKKDQLLKISFLISVVGILIGAALKIMHSPTAELLLQIAISFYLLFAALVLFEIYKSNRIEKIEKIMWTIGLLFLGSIAGILYLVAGRKRIINRVSTVKATSKYEN